MHLFKVQHILVIAALCSLWFPVQCLVQHGQRLNLNKGSPVMSDKKPWLLTRQVGFVVQVESGIAMQNLKPTIDNIKRLYGDDKKKIQRETSELYKKAQISPLAGAAPLLVSAHFTWPASWTEGSSQSWCCLQPLVQYPWSCV